MKDRIVVDGVEYVREKPSGNRAVVVVDRGWIYAGDVTRDDSGRIHLSRAVWVFGWSGCGFGAVIDDPSKGDIRKHVDIEIPAASEIFSVPVPEDWGLK